MRNLSNKNNPYTMYKAYTLNTLMRMLAVVKGDTSKSYQKDYFPPLRSPFPVVGTTMKQLYIDLYCSLTDETTACTIQLAECESALPMEVMCANPKEDKKKTRTRIKHTDLLCGDYIEIHSNTWRPDNHIGVFQGCVQIRDVIYLSYFYPSIQQKTMQGDGVLRCEIVSALTAEEKCTLFIVPVGNFVRICRRIQTSSDKSRYIIYNK
jgi:hypothetical protein